MSKKPRMSKKVLSSIKAVAKGLALRGDKAEFLGVSQEEAEVISNDFFIAADWAELMLTRRDKGDESVEESVV